MIQLTLLLTAVMALVALTAASLELKVSFLVTRNFVGQDTFLVARELISLQFAKLSFYVSFLVVILFLVYWLATPSASRKDRLSATAITIMLIAYLQFMSMLVDSDGPGLEHLYMDPGITNQQGVSDGQRHI